MEPNSDEFRALYLFRPEIAFLNHGSFGACPREVFERYQFWQRELEAQPVEFLSRGRRYEPLMREARSALAGYLNADPDDIVFQHNSTTALNLVARSLSLEEGDEVLGNDHEYGAMARTWRFMGRKTGARWVAPPIDVPVTDTAAFVEALWEHVTPRTRVLFISHVTSPTALTFPVAELCARARKAGIISIVDGAHAPSYLTLDLRAVDADFYAGNCHKWLSAPKGSAFLYARRDMQKLLEPLVVSWGWEDDRPGSSRFIDENEYQATKDPAAWLAVPEAIGFQQRHDWARVRRSCHALVEEARDRIVALTGLECLAPRAIPDVGAPNVQARHGWYAQMCAFPLPPCDVDTVKERLYDEFGVEVPVYRWNERPFVRISVQAYNTRRDIDRLVEGLEAVL